ncbi:MAG: hypothetical protein ISR47_06170 [Rhodospirillales bacterium]|nr:hypothetical protein [Rhodospirillales bacterium]
MTAIVKKATGKLSYTDWKPHVRRKSISQNTCLPTRWDNANRRPYQPKTPSAPSSAWRSIRFATSGSVRRIQAWLELHCEGRWHIGVTGMDKYLSTKFGEVHFQNAVDKQRFKAVFATKAKTESPALGAPAFASVRMAA